MIKSDEIKSLSDITKELKQIKTSIGSLEKNMTLQSNAIFGIQKMLQSFGEILKPLLQWKASEELQKEMSSVTSKTNQTEKEGNKMHESSHPTIATAKSFHLLTSPNLSVTGSNETVSTTRIEYHEQ